MLKKTSSGVYLAEWVLQPTSSAVGILFPFSPFSSRWMCTPICHLGTRSLETSRHNNRSQLFSLFFIWLFKALINMSRNNTIIYVRRPVYFLLHIHIILKQRNKNDLLFWNYVCVCVIATSYTYSFLHFIDKMSENNTFFLTFLTYLPMASLTATRVFVISVPLKKGKVRVVCMHCVCSSCICTCTRCSPPQFRFSQ